MPAWVPAGDIPAAPFADLAAPDSVLSVWTIEDNESNLNRVVAALAAGRQHPDKFDFALLDQQSLQDNGIRMQQIADPCPDTEAASLWHWNLIELTGRQLHTVATLVQTTGRVQRLSEPEVVVILKTAYNAQWIDPDVCDKEMADWLKKNG